MNSIRPSSRFGTGVKSQSPVHVTGVAEEEKESQLPPEEKDPAGKTVWHDVPTFEDQYTNPKFRPTCRLQALETRVFDLANAEDLKALNALHARELPRTAPDIVIEGKERQFSETTGNWMILISFHKVQYKKLLPSLKK
jgi:hypothetical protein